MTRTIDQMIASEVLVCMSSLVSTLAAGAYGLVTNNTPLNSLAEQAFELGAPVDDWEEAAIQMAFTRTHHGWSNKAEDFATARELCEAKGIEPYETEAYEHWAVTDWFADKLEAAGEKVDRDFAGLAVWARTATGQSIAADGVIQHIYAETHTRLEG